MAQSILNAELGEQHLQQVRQFGVENQIDIKKRLRLPFIIFIDTYKWRDM